MGRYGLQAEQWARIAHLLPGKDGDVGVTAKDNRLFVEAVLYRYRSVEINIHTIQSRSFVPWTALQNHRQR